MRTAKIILLLSLPALLGAQQTTGDLLGRIVDERQQPVAGAEVRVTRGDDTLPRLVRTNGRGAFAFRSVPPGRYTLSVRAIGYRPAIGRDVRVELGQASMLDDIPLAASTVQLEPVVVSISVIRIDPVATDHASRIDVRTIERVPVGRDISSVAVLFPQAFASNFNREGINISGATGLENSYYVDGMNVTEPFRNSGGIALPSTFIDYFELKTGSYGAESGRATGGIVSVVTRRGSPRYTGRAFSQFTASGLASSPLRGPLELATGDFSRYDAGASAGGPLGSRASYYAAYDASVVRETLRLPTGAEHEDRAHTDHFAARVDWRPTDRTDVTTTIVGDPSRRDLVGNAFWGVIPFRTLLNPEPYLGFWNTGGVATSISAIHRMGTEWMLTGEASRAQFRDETGGRGPVTEPLFIDLANSTWSGGQGNRWHRKMVRTAGSVVLGHDRSRSSTKLGVQLEQNAVNENWAWPGANVNRDGVIMSPGGIYLGLELSFQARARAHIPTAFITNSFLVNPYLRLNSGFRWDAQYFSSPTKGTHGSVRSQPQPRLGLIVYPRANENEKISAFYGRYYEQLPMQPVVWHYGGLHHFFHVYTQDPRTDATIAATQEVEYGPGSGFKGQHHDELSLAFEKNLSRISSFSARYAHRELRDIVFAGFSPAAGKVVPMNPGRGEFTSMPKAMGRYDALEVQLARESARAALRASYTLSRKYGNYAGVFDADNGNPNSQLGWSLMPKDSLTSVYAEGVLPNDRTHALKALATYQITEHVTLGGTGYLQSGTPLTEQGIEAGDPGRNYLIGRRGDLGRTPTLWDVGFRATYGLQARGASLIYVDVLHAFSPRKATRVVDTHYLARDASGPINPNPLYLQGAQFQPPMTLRVGLEIGAGARP